MIPRRALHRGLRRLRVLTLALLPLAVVMCLNDRPNGPGGVAKTDLRLRRVARNTTVCGTGPTFTLAKARVLLKGRGRTDSTVAVASFIRDTVTLTLDVPLTDATALFDISAQAIDAANDTIFRATDTVTVKEGALTTVGYLQLWYAAPDSGLSFLTIAPRDTAVRFNGQYPMRSSGIDGSDATITAPINLGFVTRDPTIATIGPGGTIVAKAKAGSTWIVGSSWLGVCDSTTVVVIPPVASVTVTPDTALIVRDGTLQLVAVTKDAAGNQLLGRVVTWSSSSVNASVDTAGLVKALVANRSARITATSEGVSATAGIGVLPKPVGKVTITPKTGIVNVGTTIPLTAVAYDSAGAVNADYAIVWTALTPTLAIVSTGGVVTGVAAGSALIAATANGSADTATITVNAAGITSTVVTPTPDTLVSINDSLALTAKSYTGATLTPGAYGWVSRDPAIVTVNSAGLVIAIGNGTTFVVATEKNGTKDSARVTVAQRPSAISVTPNGVQRYLGTTQTFLATAQDARGNAIAAAAFTWSMTDPSVASVTSGGVATMLAIGIDTVRATIGTVVGKAAFTVRPVITRITVSNSGVTLAALGRTQSYTATALDTLGVAMTGVTFAWSSTNPGVATVPGTAGTSQIATAVGNGVTAIQASAQGVVGSVPLNVAQVLFSILAGPTPISIGQGGSAQLTARGQDSTGHFMPGGTFTWTSNPSTNVTVGATTGVITAVAPPPASAQVWAFSGAIVSDTVLVTVDNSVPARVTFGHDTLTIGRGTLNNSIPVYLTKAPIAPVTVTLSARDTIGYFSPTTVSFGAGQVTTNANLNARNAGATVVHAVEGTGLYQPDSAVLIVQAAAKFATTGVGVVGGDYYATQLLLTDPAPAGGVYLTYTYGTPGIAQVSPDPAFIPQGQLAANVNVTGLAAGSTLITPSAPGVTGTGLSVVVYAARLGWSSPSQYVGTGQYTSDYVYTPAGLWHPLAIGLGSSDSNIVRHVPTVTIPALTNIVTFSSNGLKPGVVTDTASAPGWVPAIRTMIVTTPHVGACCGGSLNTTSPATTVTVTTEDSTRNVHPRTNPLIVRLTSSDPRIITIIDTTVTIAANAYSVNARVIPGGNGGTAWVYDSAGGHTGDSVQFTVAAPKLSFSLASGAIGAGQDAPTYAYVYLPNSVAQPITLTMTSSDPAVATVQGPYTIPASATSQVIAVRGLATGTATITASAPGYTAATFTLVVGTPRIAHCCNVTSVNFAPDVNVSVYTGDSLQTPHNVITPLAISYRVTNPAVATIDSTSVTVPAGSYTSATAHVHIVGVGTAALIATAPGYTPDSIPITITTPALYAYTYPPSMGVGQHTGLNTYVQIPNPRNDTLTVTITNPHSTIISTAASVPIVKGQTVAYYDVIGVGVGRDTLTASATGYASSVVPIIVTPPTLKASGLAATYNTTSPPATVYAYAEDTLGLTHLPVSMVTVKVTSSDTNVMRVDSQYVHIPTTSTITTPESVRFLGAGTAYLVFSDSALVYKSDSTAPVTVVGPSLIFNAGTTINSPLTVGMRQHLGAFAQSVYVANPVLAPLTVSLVSSDPTVATVTPTVVIPTGSTSVAFDVYGLDTIGTVQIKATATGYQQAASYVQVGRPKFSVNTNTSMYTTSPAQQFLVYAEDQAGSIREVAENVTVTLRSSNDAVASTDSATVTILKDSYFNSTAKLHVGTTAGTMVEAAIDPRSAFYHYDSASTPTVTVGVPTLSLNLPANPALQLGLDEMYQSYIYVPVPVSSDLIVGLSHTGGATATAVADTLHTSSTSALATFVGQSVGTDVITASASGYTPASGTIQVDSSRVLFSSWPATMVVGDTLDVWIYPTGPSGAYFTMATPVTLTLTPTNGNIVFLDANKQPTTQVTIAVGQPYSSALAIVAQGAGTAGVTVTGGRFATYQSSTITVTP